jgi:hypothetical protein
LSIVIAFFLTYELPFRQSKRTSRSNQMANNREVTSKRAASAASKVLRNPRSSKAAKTAAASALTQRPNRRK